MPQQKTIEVEEEKTILELASDFNFEIDGSCAGNGTCGKCKVRIEDSMGEREVLACRHIVSEDLILWIDRKNDNIKSKTAVFLPEDFSVDEALKTEAVNSGKRLGVAVDIGTTTVVVMVWDIAEKEVVGVKGTTNPQSVFGADVISRINFSNQSKENLELLHKKIIDCINDAVLEILEQTGNKPEDIFRYAVVGNTTMSHLFMGIDPHSLAVLPFEAVFTEGKRFAASDIGLLPKTAEVNLMPNIACHVGSDITAGLLTCDVLDNNFNSLYIDIGTNGEIVLNAKGKILVCSTAAGPAFEGSGIKYGMRAGSGAIEKVEISEQGLVIKTINEKEPIGICGSGIIDLIYELVKAGIVNTRGRLLSEGEGGDRIFTLYESKEKPVFITQNDIREIQLAKGAVATGWELLMMNAGISKEALDTVYIAGAFGSHIDLEKAKGIGLIPNVESEKLKSLGNAAGTGASMGLLSNEILHRAEDIRQKAEHIELSLEPQFLETYSRNMKF